MFFIIIFPVSTKKLKNTFAYKMNSKIEYDRNLLHLYENKKQQQKKKIGKEIAFILRPKKSTNEL